MCLAIPGRIISITEQPGGYLRTGKANIAGIVKEVNLELVPDAKVDDYVLIHVGVALSIVNEEEARHSLEFLKQMNELDELYHSPVDEDLTAEQLAEKENSIISKMNFSG